MFDHVTLGLRDRDRSQAVYEPLLATLGVAVAHRSEHSTLFGRFELSLSPASPSRPVTTGLHVGLAAASREAVDAFWQAGIDAGLDSAGEPGPRPEYVPDYYGAFLLDPDGNSLEACIHERSGHGRLIDHLWVRVAGEAAVREQRDYYALIAPHAGFGVVADEPALVRVRGEHGGSLTFVADGRPATSRVHLAFSGSPAQADAFHAAAIAAGHRDDGAPGPRPYHPGYYGAFVIDPGGHSTEVVDHGDFFARGPERN